MWISRLKRANSLIHIIPPFIFCHIYIHKKMKQNRFIEKRLDFQADLRYN